MARSRYRCAKPAHAIAAWAAMQTLHWRTTTSKGIVIGPQVVVRSPAMPFQESSRTQELKSRLLQFIAEHIEPNQCAYEEEVARNRREGDLFRPLALIAKLKPLAREAGLWNLFLPKS